ncbi:malate synthase G [Salisediminibacterium selenitireducens]|uniref:Malate synthase G n=1 Tax=Bacillus selenitireducens (strain ATCC 700615 / DSM 15326 / MLS10) TaxID=439292 RepID=D6XTE4_BACIE|nr:malate synthase G [Salisediminibacterium selenitireducens]ADH99080.1 Malate synthase [[Bacillus] selenitireducens MLS10]
MTEDYVTKASLKVDRQFAEWLEHLLKRADLDPESFWEEAALFLNRHHATNDGLLRERNDFQLMHDQLSSNETDNLDEYRSFLASSGYLEEKRDRVTVQTNNLDDEICRQAGPQLVVPVNNERYALNAANARWGSLYDSLYGTDVIPETEGRDKGSSYNPKRGDAVIAYSKGLLDEWVPLEGASHKEVEGYRINDGVLEGRVNDRWLSLKEKDQFVGYSGDDEKPASILLVHHRMHIDLLFDEEHPIGKTDPAGMKDIELEGATTVIADFEDSVAAVDAEDKRDVYQKWHELIEGSLTAEFQKLEKRIIRRLNEDRPYKDKQGNPFQMKGRSLLLVRNVGHLMRTDLIRFEDGSEAYEGMIDGLVTALIGKLDIEGKGKVQNSLSGSIYIVKPKMHGSKEAAFTNALFTDIEDLLKLERHTIKVGVMDEERRTSLNLTNCIEEVKDRIFFINTGFLDRTGDEIHTSFKLGPMIRKGDMKHSAWLTGYERSNVLNGLKTKLHEQGQIGKGMWAMPDEMKQMVDQKIGHLHAGGNTAWVPSPTAAVLHAIHYHQADIDSIQASLLESLEEQTNEMLTIPIEKKPAWTEDEIREELENNAQGILGYVVRWVEHGVGCSKVPDIHGTGLMEDRATLRISSQHMANWLYHGIVTEEQIKNVMKKMAKLVDRQNEADPDYKPMNGRYEESEAFQAALELVLKGQDQPSGYTEPILHRRRKQYKQKQSQGVKM